jgi:hypothetical protein
MKLEDQLAQLASIELRLDPGIPSCRFYGKDNGQAVVLFYLDDEAAAALNRWSGGALLPMLP